MTQHNQTGQEKKGLIRVFLAGAVVGGIVALLIAMFRRSKNPPSQQR